jgi:Domain of unknown function (DUF397)
MSSINIDARNVAWRKARRSVANGACVEVGSTTEAIVVRDSVDPAGPKLRYSAWMWQAFIADAKRGSFDVPR